ncbi:MAG: dsDNA nuclease domain-containing protein [Hyphomicrobiales bacterium]
MQSNLMSSLAGKAQRETAGSDTAARFDYQKDWAFCQMIKRHIAGADYLVAFEFHDDVVFLNPENAQGEVEFCQVKTSKSPKAKTAGSLVKRLTNKNSILGKMCQNFEGICSDHDLKVILVSNVAFNFSSTDICAVDLEDKYKAQIVDKLKEEFPTLDKSHLEKMHFMVSGVSLDTMASYLQGEVSNLFCHVLGEDHGINIRSWIRLVQSEITRKNNYDSSTVKSVDDLIDNKCVSKEFVTGTIRHVAKKQTVAPNMQLINNELKEAGWAGSSLMRLSKLMPNVVADFSDATNLEVAEIAGKIETLFIEHDSDDLPSFLELVSIRVDDLTRSQPYSDKSYLVALSIMVYHEQI